MHFTNLPYEGFTLNVNKKMNFDEIDLHTLHNHINERTLFILYAKKLINASKYV